MAKAKPHPDYDVSDNTYNLKRQNVKDKFWDTEVGDRRNANKFVPRIKYQRWIDGFLEIGVPNGLHGGGDSVTHEGNTIVWKRQIYTARFFDFEGDPDDDEGNGSYEWEVVLDSVPPANSLTLDLRRQNVVMYYQPPLTPQEIADGEERSDRVTGSYAIYHINKREHKPGEPDYQMGKIGHLYRPRVTDDNGDIIWGEWNDDAEATGELTLTVDAAWLAAAAYPVTIDPTFGYTSIGGSAYDASGALGIGHRNATYQYAASAGDTVTDISIYGRKQVAGVVGLAVYDVSSDVPNNLTAAQSNVTMGPSNGWYSATGLSIGLSASTTYTTAFTQFSGDVRIRYDTGAANDYSQDNIPAGALQDPWVEGATGTRIHSIYATYTAGGGSIEKTTSADAVLVDRFEKTTSADANLIARFEKTASADADLIGRFSLTTAADAIVKSIIDLTTDADSVLIDRFETTTDADGVLVARFALTTGADSILRSLAGSIELTTSADGVLINRFELTTSADGVIVDRFLLTAGADGVLVDRSEVTTSADADLIDRFEATADADSILTDRFSLTAAADAIIKSINDLTTSADGVLVDRFLKTLSADADLVDRFLLTVGADAILGAAGQYKIILARTGYITQLDTETGYITSLRSRAGYITQLKARDGELLG